MSNCIKSSQVNQSIFKYLNSPRLVAIPCRGQDPSICNLIVVGAGFLELSVINIFLVFAETFRWRFGRCYSKSLVHAPKL